jgi:hypothetical protein
MMFSPEIRRERTNMASGNLTREQFVADLTA